ncbi:MAG TPA: hypothetical protein VEC06_12050 [Paucimonas sp.]|nr:hypothetical protein [Paucimonas sp.]
MDLERQGRSREPANTRDSSVNVKRSAPRYTPSQEHYQFGQPQEPFSNGIQPPKKLKTDETLVRQGSPMKSPLSPDSHGMHLQLQQSFPFFSQPTPLHSNLFQGGNSSFDHLKSLLSSSDFFSQQQQRASSFSKQLQNLGRNSVFDMSPFPSMQSPRGSQQLSSQSLTPTVDTSSKSKLVRPFQKGLKGLAVPIGGEQEAVEIDRKGKQEWQARPVGKPPTHEQIQAEAKKFGREMREKFIGLSDTKRKSTLAKMEKLADGLEALNKGNLPKNHGEKVEKLRQAGVTGEGFRRIEPGLDEATQSQTTAAFHRGFSQAQKSDEKPELTKQADLLQYHYLRAQSAMRLKTEDVVAPIDLDGETRGQRHPTSKGFPTFAHGGSGHTQADRERASTWVDQGRQQGMKSTGVFKPLATALVFAGSRTLDRMSFPLQARNVDSSPYNSTQVETQTERREVLKRQTNYAADMIRVARGTGTQSSTAPKTFIRDRATSPERK